MASFSSSTDRQCGAAALVVCAVLAGGCGRLYLNNQPVIQPGVVAVPPPSARAQQTGSLWRENVSANFFFSDVRAHYPGDLVTIVVVENSSGSKDAETSTKTKTSISGNLKEFFGLPQQVQKHQPNINPEQLIEADAEREWDGVGSTTRNGKLTARMTAQVTAVGPTGNLWVEGEKVVSVNHEDQHITVSGWVRPEDINALNEVESTRLAFGRLDYYGVGVVGSKQRPGWGTWLVDLVWPF